MIQKSATVILIFSALLVGCGEPDFAERKLPNKTETCGGQAIQSRYIVRYKNGKWKNFVYDSREKFKAEIVEPELEEIDFIEYDQKIQVRAQKPISAQAARLNWGPESIGADRYWQTGNYGEGVTIAVVDSGVDISHPLLRNQIAYNNGERGLDHLGRNRESNGIDDDGNGYVDDFAGFDFTTLSGDLTDELYHGTHVAGIIAAEHADTTISSTRVQGVAPKTKILPVKFLSDDGGYLSDAIKSIDYAVERGAQIINASWGGTGCSQSLRQKVKDLTSHNVLFVVAAGNSGSNLDRYPEYPAAFNLPFQITVGSVTPNALPAGHSNYSVNIVDLFAPGTDIVSTIPGNRTVAYEGTSMATPFVSAAAALFLSVMPQSSVSELKAQIIQSVVTESIYLNKTNGRLYLPQALNH